MTEEGTKLSFQDFIASVDAKIRKFREIASPVKLNFDWKDAPKSLGDLIPDFRETHLFHLGDDETILEAIRPIREDLAEECRFKIPMPFRDVSCVSIVPWKGKNYWILDRLIESPVGRKPPTNAEELRSKGLELRQHFLIIRHTENDERLAMGISTPMVWDCWFLGASASSYNIMTMPDVWCQAVLEDQVGKANAYKVFERLGQETIPILEQLAVISHPQNYVVKVVPDLTPREARRALRGEPRPIQKSEHFIVVDHDVLVRMSRPAGGTHASPVPHERRGHWRRVAERCRMAREGGRDKVFVKPTYVGERVFSYEKSRYEVVLGLESRPKADAGATA